MIRERKFLVVLEPGNTHVFQVHRPGIAFMDEEDILKRFYQSLALERIGIPEEGINLEGIDIENEYQLFTRNIETKGSDSIKALLEKIANTIDTLAPEDMTDAEKRKLTIFLVNHNATRTQESAESLGLGDITSTKESV